MNNYNPDDGGNYLTESQGLKDLYMNPLQEQSFSPVQERPQKPSTRSISVSPEEIVFDDVSVPEQGNQSSMMVPKIHSKLQLKNMLSSPIELVLKSSCDDKIKFEPRILTLSAFESTTIKVWLVTNSFIKYKKPCKIKEYLLLKTEFFDQKVNVTINLSAAAEEPKREKSLESSVNSMSYSYRQSRQMGGGMTNALQKMRSLSRDIKEQKTRIGGGQDSNRSYGMGESERIPGRTQADVKKGLGDSSIMKAKFNNLTASFNQEEFDSLVKEEKKKPLPPLGKQISIADLEASHLRNDLDESAIDDDYEDIQRSNNHEANGKSELNITDMSNNQLDFRDPNDQSMSINQLEQSKYSYSQSKSALTGFDNNQISGLTQMDQTERINSLQNEIKGYQKIITQQQQALKVESEKRVSLQNMSGNEENGATIICKIQSLLHQQAPDLEELLQLSLNHDREQQAQTQKIRDNQVLAILKQKDQEIAELQYNLEKVAQEKEKHVQESQMQIEKLQSSSQMALELQYSKQLLQNESNQSQKQLMDQIESLKNQLEKKEFELINMLSENDQLKRELESNKAMNTRTNEKYEENQILVAELERMEMEKQKDEKRSAEMIDQFKSQTKLLQSKLSKAYQDIQTMVQAQSMKKPTMNMDQATQTQIDTQKLSFLLSLESKTQNVSYEQNETSIMMDDKYLISNQKQLIDKQASQNTLKESDPNELSRIKLDPESFIQAYKANLMKQAEIEYDARQKQRDDRIRNYFDAEVMTHIRGMDGSNGQEQDIIELTRKFCDLQLQIDKYEQLIQELQLEVQGHQQFISQLSTSDEAAALKLQIEMLNSQIEQLKNQKSDLNKANQQSSQNQFAQLRQELQYMNDQNSNQMAQIDSLKTELVIAEKKLEDERNKQMKLQDDISAYKDTITEVKKNFAQQTIFGQAQTNDEDYQSALQGRHQQSTQSQSSQPATARPSSARGKKMQAGKKKGNMLQRGSSVESLDESTSQATTANVNILNTGRSNISSMPQVGADQFINNPPKLVNQLIEAKLLEKQMKVQMANCLQNENNIRQEMRKMMMEFHNKGEPGKTELLEEKIKRSDLEQRVRELEYQIFQDASTKANAAQSNLVDHQNPQNVHLNDLAMLSNTVIYLINKQMNADSNQVLSDVDVHAQQEQDSVYKLIIFQLSKKLQSLVKDSKDHAIDQYVPSGARNQKIWYLELLESQLITSEQMINKLYEFVKCLQIDIQGCLTSAAQIKATSMELASNTNETLQEIKLLKNVALLIRNDLQSTNTINQNQPNPGAAAGSETINARHNPFAETHMINQTSTDLQNQLNITAQVKNSMENEMANLKKTLFESKNQFREQLDLLTAQNEQLTNQLKNTEEELVPRLRKENKTLMKQLNELQQEHKLLASKAIVELDQKEKDIEEKKMKLKAKHQVTNQQETMFKEEMQRMSDNWAQEKLEFQNNIFILETRIEELKEAAAADAAAKSQQPSIQTIDSTVLNKQEELIIKYKSKVAKLKNKLLQKDERVKELELKEEQLKQMVDQNNMNQLKIGQLEIQCRDGEILIKTQEQSLKQLYDEKKNLLLEKQQLEQKSQENSRNIQDELNQLRQSFSDCLAQMMGDMNKAQKSEAQWKETVTQLKQNINDMQKAMGQQQKERDETITTIEAKDEQLMLQLKHLRNENAAIKQDNKTLFDQIAMADNAAYEKDQQLNLYSVQLHEQNRLKIQQQNEIQIANQNNKILKDELVKLEIEKDQQFDVLISKIEEVKNARSNLQELYEYQVEILKAKMQILKPNADKEIDQCVVISQRDALIKNLKKENALLKTQNTKYKLKQKELKKQVLGMNAIETDDFKILIAKAQDFNKLQQKMVETQANSAKVEEWNVVLTKRTQDQENIIAELREESQEIMQKNSKESKLQKNVNSQSDIIRNLKNEIKELENTVNKMKSTWQAPDKQKTEAGQIKDLQQQIKQLKEEVNRKKDLIQSLKNKQETIEKEKNEAVSELASMKEENGKLGKQIKTISSSSTALKQVKQELDNSRQSVQSQQQELQQLTEKLKTAKNDVIRKEMMIKELKQDKSTLPLQKAVVSTTSRNEKELEMINEENKKKMKEMKQRHKLDLEIKENLIRSLKLKIEQTLEEMEEIRQDKEEDQHASNMPLQIELAEKQQKKDKNKLKKYEKALKRTMLGISEICKKLKAESKLGMMENKNMKPTKDSIVDDEDMYRESMDVLGFSMGELEEFMNPGKDQGQHQIEQILLCFDDIVQTASAADLSSKLTAFLKNDGLLADVAELEEYCMKAIDSLK